MVDYESIQQMKDRIHKLSLIGKETSGGTTRLSYSPAYRQAIGVVRNYMEQAGMTVKLDGAGNLIGTYQGTNSQLAAVMVGSHLDTVPHGGAFDGALGIVTAIECIHRWNQAEWQPERTVKVIAAIEEEGTLFGMACFGSRAMAGEFSVDKQREIADNQRKTLADYLAALGLGPEIQIDAENEPPQLHCYLELHVEQGAELEQSGLPLGVVTAIVGIDRIGIQIRGKANHAGTTRMDQRRDALVAAASLVNYVQEKALAANGKYVATIGKLDVYPNAENVVPGEVILTLEIRAAEETVIEAVRGDVFAYMESLEHKYGVACQKIKHHQIPPVKLNNELISHLCAAADGLGLPYRKLPSWAGHDAMTFAKFIPAAMLFVPSIGGISHSPEEASDWEAIFKAAQVLNETLKGLSSQAEYGVIMGC